MQETEPRANVGSERSCHHVDRIGCSSPLHSSVAICGVGKPSKLKGPRAGLGWHPPPRSESQLNHFMIIALPCCNLASFQNLSCHQYNRNLGISEDPGGKQTAHSNRVTEEFPGGTVLRGLGMIKETHRG